MQKDSTSLWLGKPVPRYTSYPTAPHFKEGFTAEAYAFWLRELPESASLSLYLHIPFCEKLCWFCGCTTSITSKYEPVKRYLETLKKEIALVSSHIVHPLSVHHIHFGGGSPTMLHEDDFSSLMQTLRTCFNIAADVEIAVEIDPRTMTKEKADAYGKCGVNRASIGVQDFDSKVQEAIHRVQPFAVVKQACDWLREAGIQSLNMDLIYGLPYQTGASFSDTLEQTLKLQPERLALFSYAHVPWVKKHQRVIDTETLPDDMTKLAMYQNSSRLFKNAGYISIGIDHFSRVDDELAIALKNHSLKRNFQGYTADDGDVLIGLGLSSIGSLPQGYIQNQITSSHYQKAIEQGQLPVMKGITVTQEDQLRKQVIDNLMCFMDVSPADIAIEHGKHSDYFAVEMDMLKPFCNAGIITIFNGRITLVTEHRMAVRAVAAVFDQYMANSNGKYSKVA